MKTELYIKSEILTKKLNAEKKAETQQLLDLFYLYNEVRTTCRPSWPREVFTTCQPCAVRVLANLTKYVSEEAEVIEPVVETIPEPTVEVKPKKGKK